MAPTAIEKAERERAKVKLNVQYLEGKVNDQEAHPIPLIKAIQYLEAAQSHKNKLEHIQDKIIQLVVEEADLQPHSQEYIEILDRIIDVQYKLEIIKRSHDVPQVPPVQAPPQTKPISLPRLELPSFSGNLEQWMSYRDMFKAAIQDNANLSKAQKLTYLKSTLTGEAARLIQCLSVTDDNYDIAWTQLSDRYQNDRELLYTILKRFFSQPNVQPQSSSSLRSLIDVSKECIRSLQTLKRPVDKWDDIILFFMFQKLDQTSKEFWEQSLKDNSIPTLKSFLDFLETRARALRAGGSIHAPKIQVHRHEAGHRIQHRVNQVHHVIAATTCSVCNANHQIFNCKKFISMQVSERYDVARKNSLCFNCIRSGHSSINCSSKYTCRKCNRSHNSLLHKDSNGTENAVPTTPKVDPAGSNMQQEFSHHSSNGTAIQQTLLATALVNVQDISSQPPVFRALYDPGSTCSFVTESCVKLLGLPRSRANADIRGLASMSLGRTMGVTTLTISSRFNGNEIISNIKALIVPKITGQLPSYPCDPTVWPHLQGLQLADPHYYQPGEINILLGGDISFNHLLDGIKTGPEGFPVGIRTTLGWLIGGKLNLISNKVLAHHMDIDLDHRLQQFWEIEAVPETRSLTAEEKQCEIHFQETHSRDNTGRFVVKLPFKTPQPVLGSSRPLAIRRLQQLERRLTQMPDRRSEYNQFMDEYLEMGHMELVQPSQVSQPLHPTCYIPHHFVTKESSTTTKLRVVFDASAKTSTGNPLNDALMVGPTVQDTLVSTLIRFRIHPIAFTADLAKMYRQISVTKEDMDMQRIVWRNSPTDPIQDYRLRTVTYGTAPAPFLATRALQELAVNEKESYPLASEAILNNMYVDDLMASAPTEQDAIQVQQQLLKATARGGLTLRKWASNSTQVIEALPFDLRETTTLLELNSDQTIKALGIYWNTNQDFVEFKLNLEVDDNKFDLTKRKLLSQIAKIFDPQGWLAPVIIRAKIMMQQLWKLQIGWDDLLPEPIQQQWYDYRDNLHLIESINISRCLYPVGYNSVNLMGFCDASERAFAAVVYVVAYKDDQKPVISLIQSKTRVAPAKQVTLPRLELCGAVLLAQLMVHIRKSLKCLSFNNIMAYSDSTVVLSWLNSQPSRWKTFVANRVSEVQTLLPAQHWKHISGEINPADCASRGIDPSELQQHPLWWQGPPWLKMGSYVTQPQGSTHTDDFMTNLEERQEVIFSNHVCFDSSLIDRFSSFTRLNRITSWLLRFTHNCQVRIQKSKMMLPCNQKLCGPLSLTELQTSLLYTIRVVQQQSFSDELSCLSNNRPLSPKSRLLNLNPYIDYSQILRVGGRLRHAPMPLDQKNPILLPRHHTFTKLLITHEHIKHLHGGPQRLLSVISRRFWIVRARDAIRHLIKKCIVCSRHAAVMQQQFMADLPSARVTPSRPFMKCGVDYAGPFMIKPVLPRSKTTLKAYLCIFVCFSTRAVHLEVTSSLSTEAFLASFRRFIARRGRPSDIFSDCGTNFKGAAKELKEMAALINSSKHNKMMTYQMSGGCVTWHFNPPGAPHFGGLWEAGVKSTKFHLYRVLGNSRLNFEELTTVMNQIEACLNSRPLTPMSTDPKDMMALTPGHFLIGTPLTSIPDPDLKDEKITRLNRWKLLQQLTQHFWRRWSSEFLTRLQQRPKWLKLSNNIKINSLVLIKDENLPPLKWKLGRVINLHPGSDGIVRVVSLKTTDGEFKRPIVKICLLPIDSEQCNET